MAGSSPRNEDCSWIWLSAIPIFGGAAIVAAGHKTNNLTWFWTGIAFIIGSMVLASQGLLPTIWLGQIGFGFYIRQKLQGALPQAKNSPRSFNPALLNPAKEKVDINTCSKNDLVYKLGLPIIYANDIDAVRQEGHMFTHVEELEELAGLPDNYTRAIAPYVVFSYDLNKEADTSWRCLNNYSIDEFVIAGIDRQIAEKIVKERDKNGSYRSAIDVKNRTGIPLKCYQHII